MIGLGLSLNRLHVDQLGDVRSRKSMMAAVLTNLVKAEALQEIYEVVKGHVSYVSLSQSLEQLATVHGASIGGSLMSLDGQLVSLP